MPNPGKTPCWLAALCLSFLLSTSSNHPSRGVQRAGHAKLGDREAEQTLYSEESVDLWRRTAAPAERGQSALCGHDKIDYTVTKHPMYTCHNICTVGVVEKGSM